MVSEEVNGDIILGGLAAVAGYIYFSSWLEHRKLRFVHQTGVAIIMGFLMGLVIYFLFNDYFVRMLDFNDTVVFFVLLPPMLFADGYNLKKRRFFQNLYYINIYGILGTLLNFVVIASLTYGVSELGLVRDLSNFSNIRKLEIWQVLLFSACMCSTDPIASLSDLKPETHPKLFSIVFGESLIKDSITIVLYKSIEKLVKVNGSVDLFSFYWYTPFSIAGNFIAMIAASVALGLAFAIVLTLVFKHSRFVLKDKGITEVSLIFLTGYMSYIVSELLEFSGVITMLFCGITLSHFNNYNMSEEGVKTSKVTFETVALIAEGFLFLLLGVASWEVEGDSQEGIVVSESITFIFLALAILFVARVINVYLISILFRPCRGKQRWRLNRYELQILFAAGLVKGAVPFALTTSTVLIETPVKVTSLIIKSTVIIIVLFSSLIINGLLPTFIRNRLKAMKKNVPPNHPSLFDSLIQKQRKRQNNSSGTDDSPQPLTFTGSYKHTSAKYWKKFDEHYLKPFLIYNYAHRKEQIKQQKRKQRLQELQIEQDDDNDEEFRTKTQNADKMKESLISTDGHHADEDKAHFSDDSDDQQEELAEDEQQRQVRNRKKLERQQKRSKHVNKKEFTDYIPTNPVKNEE